MAKESSLQIYSFEVSPESIPEMKIYCLKMPSEVKEYLGKFKNSNNAGYSMKLDLLSKAIQSFFPEVVYCYSKINIIEDENIFWLYSQMNFDLRAIKICVRIWLEAEAELRRKEIGEVVFKDKWEWTKQINSQDVLNLKGEQYGIIPAIFAYDFCHKPPMFATINRLIKFNVFYVDGNHVCISEYIDIRKKRFSFAINFSLINHRDYPGKMLINVDISVKAWETSGLIKDGTCYLKGGEGKSVFFSLENQFLNFEKKQFIQVKITRKDAVGCKWNDIGGKVFSEFLNNEYNNTGFEIDQAITEPMKYMDGNKGVTMYITSSLKDGKKIKMVQPGPGLPIRKELFHIISEKYQKLIPRNKISEIKVQSLNKDVSCPYLPYEVKKLYFEVYTKDLKLSRLVVDSLKDILKLEMVEDNLYKSNHGLLIKFEFLNPSNITRLFDSISEYEHRVKQAEEGAVKYSDSDFPVLCLVDIPAYHQKDEDERDDDVSDRSKFDPKNAIRIGMKNAGRLTQFINGIDDGICNLDKNKVKSCILDLLSDAGFQEGIFKLSGYEDKIILGVMSIEEPSMYVLSKFEKGMPYIKFYGDEKWSRLPNSLLNITAERTRRSRIEYVNKKVAFESWILDEIQKILNEHKSDIVHLFCDVSLRNMEWGFLKNNDLDISTLRLVGKERLRVIRVNEGHEIPDYFIDDGDESEFEKSFKFFIGNLNNEMKRYKSLVQKDGKFTISRTSKQEDYFVNSEILDSDELFEDGLKAIGIKKQIFLGLTKINIDEKYYPVIYRLNNNKSEIIFFEEKSYSELNEDSELCKSKITGTKLLMSSKDIKDIGEGTFVESNELKNINKGDLIEWVNSVLYKTENHFDDNIYILCTEDFRCYLDEISNNNELGIIDSIFSFNSLDINLECYELVKYQEHRKYYNKAQLKIHEKFIGNKNQGLFSENQSTFYSVGQRSDSMQSSTTATKLSDPTAPLNKQRMVEFIVVGECTPDQLTDIGRMAHNLRKMNLTFKVHTKLPLPLFIINKHLKYLKALYAPNKNYKK